MSNNRREFWTLLALVCASGACALVYQVVFVKLAVLVFGATVDAMSTVVSAFIAGLAAGSYVAGRIADRIPKPLLFYGAVEGIIGLFCVPMPLYFQAITASYTRAAAIFPNNFFWLTSTRIALAAAVIFIPTFLMGASLPLVARHLIRKQTSASGIFSKLYGSNTLGAAVGVLVATYGLLPNWGVGKTIWLAAGMNFGIAAVAIGVQLIWLNRKAPTPWTLEPASESITPQDSHTIPTSWLFLTAFLSGFLALSLEVIWTHLLHLTVGGSAYVVGAILFSILLGLALGAVLVPPLLRWVPDPRLLLITSASVTALVLAVHMPIWNRLPEIFPLLGPLHLGFGAREGLRFLLIAFAVLLPTLCLGTLFPLAVGLALRDVSRVGRTIGQMVAANAVGSILGPLAAGFIILPALGSEGSLRVHALIYALLAVPVWWSLRIRFTRNHWVARMAAIPLAVIVILVFSRWDPRPLTSGANVYFTAGFRDYDQLLYMNESVHGGVTTVIEKDKIRTLLTNGKFQGTTGPESFFQTNMALVPMTLLPRMETALNIGLGTGQTLATMAIGPFRRIDVAEIAPEIVEAARQFFTDINRGVLDDPRIHIEEVDGRNFLLLHPEVRYDLITIQLNSIWLAGAASLYSREFYDLCRLRLAPGGILQQWLQLHHMRWEDQLAVIATLGASFPYIGLWSFGHQAIVLGSDQPLLGDYEAAIRLEPAFRAAGALDGFATRSLLSAFAYYHLDNTAARALLRDAIPADRLSAYISTDLHPLLEYGTPRGVSHLDSAATFFRKSAPYSYLPLSSMLVNMPPHEIFANLRLLEDERGKLSALLSAPENLPDIRTLQ